MSLAFVACSDNNYTPTPAATTVPTGTVYPNNPNPIIQNPNTTTGVLPMNSGIQTPANTAMIGINAHAGINLNGIYQNCISRTAPAPLPSNQCMCYRSPCHCEDADNVCVTTTEPALTNRQIRLQNRIQRISDRNARSLERKRAKLDREEEELARKRSELRSKTRTRTICYTDNGCDDNNYANETTTPENLSGSSVETTVDQLTKTYSSVTNSSSRKIISASIVDNDARALYRRLRIEAANDGFETKYGTNYFCQYDHKSVLGVRLSNSISCHFTFIMNKDEAIGNLTFHSSKSTSTDKPLDDKPDFSGTNVKVGSKAGQEGEIGYIIFRGSNKETTASELFDHEKMPIAVITNIDNNGKPEPAEQKTLDQLVCYHFTDRHPTLTKVEEDYVCYVKVDVGTGTSKAIENDPESIINKANKPE